MLMGTHSLAAYL
ncbi:hypothetical protein VCHC41A1_2976, partial [Vibrio cholerae HC-41A1]